MTETLARVGDAKSRARRLEIFAFFFLTVIVMPALTIAFVGGWGLVVWIFQIFMGPPGAPLPPPQV